MESIREKKNSEIIHSTKQQPKRIISENEKGIENHRAAAAHLEAAAMHHLEAAKHHAAGNHDKAHKSAIYAHEHHSMATEYAIADIKHHANNG